MLADLVRDAADRFGVPVQRHRSRGRSTSVTRSTTTTSTSSAPTALHGVFVIPKDLPSTIASTMPIFRAENKMGIKSDAEFGESGTAIQTDYTQVAQAMKSNNSTYGRNGLDYKGTVLMRKEAQVQGVNTVKVWDCSVQCYDKRLIQEGGERGRGPVRVAQLPAVRGQGLEPRRSTGSSSTTRRPTASAPRRSSPVRSSPGRSTTR